MNFLRTLILAAALTASTAAQVRIPAWAGDAVWYQIFPERFRNGDTTNDPTAAELEFASSRDWHVSPWTSDWYKLQPWEEKHSGNFYENVFDRRYGGDLQGVIDKLDYLSGLGINAIYFNPLFEAYSMHKYDASSYHHIDNNFGPNSIGDLALMESETDDPATWRWSAADSLFLQLLHEAHARNIRIIIDGVFNHCGIRFFAFKDVAKSQRQSRYADWFDVKRWDDPTTTENEFHWKGWWDHKYLPEFREDENGFMPAVWNYFFNITRRWMDPNGDGNPSDGVDGWRLDVANDVSHKFWKSWRTHVKSINPDAYIVGELWDRAEDWLRGDEFDAVMNYPFAKASVRFFINTDGTKLSASGFLNELERARAAYADAANYALQNLYDSHDTDRLPSMIANPNRKYDDHNSPRNNPNYNIGRPDRSAHKIQWLMMLFQMTYLGAPMVYYGDEAGMWGADDPDDRKPMVWNDLLHEPETARPLDVKFRAVDSVRFDSSTFAFYKKIIALRKSHSALTGGSFRPIFFNDVDDVFAFERKNEKETITVVINNGLKLTTVNLPLMGTYLDAFEDEKYVGAKRLLPVSLESKSFVVLIKK